MRGARAPSLPADHALVDGAPSDAPLFFGTGASPSPPPTWYADCGYTGKPIRRTEEIKALVGDLTNYKGEEVSKYDLAMQLVDVVLNGPLTWSLGTCEEYSDVSNHSMPVPLSSVRSIFVDTPSARFCGGALTNVAIWCDLLVVIGVIAFLVYLRWLVKKVAVADDKSMWTTGDYAVLLRNLKHGLDEEQPLAERMTADVLREQLALDLAELGFTADKVVQIETGRKCADELALIKKLEKVNIDRHELAARKLYRAQKRQGLMRRKTVKVQPADATTAATGATTTTATATATASGGLESPRMPDVFGGLTEITKRAQVAVNEKMTDVADAAGLKVDDADDAIAEDHEELREDMHEILDELNKIYDEPDFATGHAFIVFQYEKDKNALLKLYNTDGKAPPVLSRTAPEGVQVTAHAAPEPSEVNWAALEINDAQQLKASITNWLLIVLMLIASAALILIIRMVKQLQTEEGIVAGSAGTGFSFLMIVLSSLATALTNFGFKVIITKITHREGRDTTTDHEASLFVKLAVAYVVNSAAIPVLVGVFVSGFVNGEVIDQSWYERSGVVGQAWLLLMVSSFGKEFPKIFPVVPIIKRRFMVARSQAKLNQLWEPARLYIGELYANTLKLVSLALVYGPLCPISYLWAFVGLLVCNVCTTFGVSRWYARPPAVDEGMMMAMRMVVGMLLLVQVVMAAFAADSIGFRGHPAAFYIGPVLWLLYTVAPLGRLSMFRSAEEEEEDGEVTDTMNIPYNQVASIKGYEMQPYICPKITKRIYESVVNATKSIDEGDEPAAADVVDDEPGSAGNVGGEVA